MRQKSGTLAADRRLGVHIARITTWIVAAVSGLATIALPLGHFYFGYLYAAGRLEGELDIQARLLREIIAQHPGYWEFEAEKLQRSIATRRSDAGMMIYGVTDAYGMPVVQVPSFVDMRATWPAIARRIIMRWGSNVRLGVYLSPLQFQAPGLAETVRQILAEQQFNPQRLEIEITEGVLLRDHASTHATLQALKALGVSIAMDDFGTGYSSLGHLRRFPFDRIKIDRAFISDLAQDAHAQAIVRSIIALAGTLSMPVIAEGVETNEQAMLLLREGCREAQGYLFGKPMPAEAIAELLASRAAAA